MSAMAPVEELTRAREALQDISDLDAAARKLGRHSNAAKAVQRVRDRIASTPVRISTSAKLLDLSVPTVNQWADEGILENLAGTPRRVTLRSVARIRDAVAELRELGLDQNLRGGVLGWLEDRGTLEDKRFLRSLEEMRRGELLDVTP